MSFLFDTSRLSSLLLPHATETDACPIHILSEEQWQPAMEAMSATAQTYIKSIGLTHGAGKTALLPASDGTIDAVLLCQGHGKTLDRLMAGKLPGLLPDGDYRFAEPIADAEMATLAFLLGAYAFTRYKSADKPDAKVRLRAPAGVDFARVAAMADAIVLGRDLINTPTSDLGPEAFAEAALAVAGVGGAEATITIGDALLEAGFPMVHAVGRASAEPPRLVDFSHGDPSHPKVTLVGKSVCFDTGGLNIKPDASMLLMKKDMGGGAITLAIAQLVMQLRLPVRLRVILPIVENSIAGNAFRPGDVLQSRKGLSVEIGNTDAEGRLILADALALADEESPDLLLDFATLTGAARVALGPELPPCFTDDETLATEIAAAATEAADPCWRLPLWNNYDAMLSSKIADVNHIGGGPMAGAIVAALFLRRFVSPKTCWAHFDTFAWNPATRPGRPEGGEAQLVRLVLALIEGRYGRT